MIRKARPVRRPSLRRDVRGASGIEYAMLMAMVAVMLGFYAINIQTTILQLIYRTFAKF